MASKIRKRRGNDNDCSSDEVESKSDCPPTEDNVIAPPLNEENPPSQGLDGAGLINMSYTGVPTHVPPRIVPITERAHNADEDAIAAYNPAMFLVVSPFAFMVSTILMFLLAMFLWDKFSKRSKRQVANGSLYYNLGRLNGAFEGRPAPQLPPSNQNGGYDLLDRGNPSREEGSHGSEGPPVGRYAKLATVSHKESYDVFERERTTRLNDTSSSSDVMGGSRYSTVGDLPTLYEIPQI